MQQLSLFDPTPGSVAPAPIPPTRPAQPAPRQRITQVEAIEAGYEPISRHRLARMSFEHICPLAFIGARAWCAECSLLRDVAYNPDAGRLALHCKLPQYLDPGTGNLAAEYLVVPDPTSSFIREIRLLDQPVQVVTVDELADITRLRLLGAPDDDEADDD